jgi:hypothetical protein
MKRTMMNVIMMVQAFTMDKRKKPNSSRVILLFIFMISLSSDKVFSEANFSKSEISINGFRNPSIGLEYRKGQHSIHGGYYVTNFEPNITTRFYKFGTSYWFLPSDLSFDQSGNPSSFYAGISYGNGINLEYENKSALMIESGYRWFIWRGLNFRLGVIGLYAQGESAKLNPTPGISYSIFF